MIFLLFDGDIQIGNVPDVDAVKRMSRIHEADTGHKPEVFVKIGDKIEPWGGE